MYDFKKAKRIEHARKRQQASRAISFKSDTLCSVCGDPLTVGNLTAVIFYFPSFGDICINCISKERNGI